MTEKFFDVSAFAYAHRGLWGGDVPENSLAAFRRAASGAFGAELDVRLTASGLPVVFHDPTFERLCGDPRRVDQISLQELWGIRLPDGSNIPLLEDALSVMGDNPVLIELKVDTPGDTRIADAVMRLLKDRAGRYGLMSFDDTTVAWLCEQTGERPVGLLISPEPLLGAEGVTRQAGKALAMGCDFLGPHLTSLATTAKVGDGLPLAAWTVRTADQYVLARRHGAAPIFEDFSADLAKPPGTPI